MKLLNSSKKILEQHIERFLMRYVVPASKQSSWLKTNPAMISLFFEDLKSKKEIVRYSIKEYPLSFSIRYTSNYHLDSFIEVGLDPVSVKWL